MAKEQPQDIRLSIEVPVSASEYAYLEANANGKPPAEKLTAYTKWLFARQVAGGLMLEPQDMEYLGNLNKGQRFATSRDVVKAVEIALKREEGQYSFKITIPVEDVAPLEENAKWAGITVEEWLNDFAAECIHNGWYKEFSPSNGRLIPLDEKDVLTARRVTGKVNFSGREIGDALVRLEALEKGLVKPGRAAA